MTYNGYTISDILDMTIEESLTLLEERPKIMELTKLLCDVGLGYLKWGQSVRTLSGGEGQRIKLAKELSKKTRNHTLYLLDEPSTGLHPGDVLQLLLLLNRLVDAGNTVILVEHNLDLIWNSDWILDIGPGGEPPADRWLQRERLRKWRQWKHRLPAVSSKKSICDHSERDRRDSIWSKP